MTEDVKGLIKDLHETAVVLDAIGAVLGVGMKGGLVRQGAVELHRMMIENQTIGPLNDLCDTYKERAEKAEADIAAARAELGYAYLCVSSGYNHGVFDFSVLKDRALAYAAERAEVGS